MRPMTSRLNAGPRLRQYSSTNAFAFSSERTESSHWLRSSAVRKYASGELIQSRGEGGGGAAAANSGSAALATSTAARSRVRRIGVSLESWIDGKWNNKKAPAASGRGSKRLHQRQLELVAGADLEAARTLPGGRGGEHGRRERPVAGDDRLLVHHVEDRTDDAEGLTAEGKVLPHFHIELL